MNTIETAKSDERPQRFGWAPGEYYNLCRTCNEHFIGDKRASMCADCAYALPDDWTANRRELSHTVLEECRDWNPEADQWKSMARELAEALRDAASLLDLPNEQRKIDKILQKFDALPKK